jgi:hypothetical protein
MSVFSWFNARRLASDFGCFNDIRRLFDRRSFGIGFWGENRPLYLDFGLVHAVVAHHRVNDPADVAGAPHIS